MLWKGEVNYQGQCFTLYTHGYESQNPLNKFCYQIAKKLYPEAPSRELRTASRRIYMTLSDGFDRYKISEVKKDAS